MESPVCLRPPAGTARGRARARCVRSETSVSSRCFSVRSICRRSSNMRTTSDIMTLNECASASRMANSSTTAVVMAGNCAARKRADSDVLGRQRQVKMPRGALADDDVAHASAARDRRRASTLSPARARRENDRGPRAAGRPAHTRRRRRRCGRIRSGSMASSASTASPVATAPYNCEVRFEAYIVDLARALASSDEPSKVAYPMMPAIALRMRTSAS